MEFVRPIKKSAKDKVENYRPLCLTCSTSKLMERLLCSAITNFLHENNLLTSYQHGFLSHRSTTSALLSTVPVWQREINKGNAVSVVNVDYCKAFDSILIPLLLKKVHAVGIVGRLHRFLQSFLTQRTQSVLIPS